MRLITEKEKKSRFRLELTSLSRELEVLAIPGGILSSGNYQTLFKGAGLEFKDHREFAPRDDVRRIDWKASLKANTLLVKEYQEERNAEILFCVDVSNGMVFGSKKLKNHYTAEFVASLQKHIIEAGNATGLLTFNKKVKQFIPPEIGEQQVHISMDILSSFSTYGGQGGFLKLFDFLENVVAEQTTVFIVSDFFRFRKLKKYKRKLDALKRKFEFVFVIVRDPIEEFLETGGKPVILIHPESNLNILVEPSKIKKEYVLETKKEKERLKNFLDKTHIPFMELYTDKAFVQPLYELFVKMGAVANH